MWRFIGSSGSEIPSENKSYYVTSTFKNISNIIKQIKNYQNSYAWDYLVSHKDLVVADQKKIVTIQTRKEVSPDFQIIVLQMFLVESTIYSGLLIKYPKNDDWQSLGCPRFLREVLEVALEYLKVQWGV